MTSSETPYRFETAEGYSIISLHPELNDSQWADFEKVGNEVIEQLNTMNPPAFVVDLSSLSYMGSAMVALIVRLWKAVSGRNGRMVVVNQHEMVFEVLKLAGLHKVWTIVETREEGLKQLGMKARPAGSLSGGGAAGGSSTGMVVLGIIGVVGAVGGLGLLLSGEIVEPKVALAISIGSAALGLIMGTVIAARDVGTRQMLGIGVVVASVVAVLAGVLLMPAGGQSGGGRPAPAADDDEEDEDEAAIFTAPAILLSAEPGTRRSNGSC